LFLWQPSGTAYTPGTLRKWKCALLTGIFWMPFGYICLFFYY
jgi:hypothetical protein